MGSGSICTEMLFSTKIISNFSDELNFVTYLLVATFSA